MPPEVDWEAKYRKLQRQMEACREDDDDQENDDSLFAITWVIPLGVMLAVVLINAFG